MTGSSSHMLDGRDSGSESSMLHGLKERLCDGSKSPGKTEPLLLPPPTTDDPGVIWEALLILLPLDPAAAAKEEPDARPDETFAPDADDEGKDGRKGSV